jgi:hypothetical protein
VIDANLGACGLTGSVVIGTQLTGDAFYGTWSGFEPGTVDNTQSASTTFYWTPSQVGRDVVLVFEPTSVCVQTATITVRISSACPRVLSTAEVVGIAVGATVGGLILIILTTVVAMYAYRVWNRSRVNINADADTDIQHSYYKF